MRDAKDSVEDAVQGAKDKLPNSLDKIPGFGSSSSAGGNLPSVFDNATTFLRDFSSRFDSSKNFTLNPSKLFARVRERMRDRIERFRERWTDLRLRVANRTVNVLDRMLARIDKRLSNLGDKVDTKQGFLASFRSFVESLRNTILGMIDNLKNRIPNRPKWPGGSGGGASGASELEHEETDSKTLAELNAALKKLDKMTLQKFNEV